MGIAGIEAGRASMPVQGKIPMHSLLNFLFLKTSVVPQFFVLTSQTVLVCTICGLYRMLTSGFH